MSELLTIKEIESIFKVHRQTVYLWRKKGMPYVKLGPKSIRFNLDDVMEWMKENN